MGAVLLSRPLENSDMKAIFDPERVRVGDIITMMMSQELGSPSQQVMTTLQFASKMVVGEDGESVGQEEAQQWIVNLGWQGISQMLKELTAEIEAWFELQAKDGLDESIWGDL